MNSFIPAHLKQYIVPQNYPKYSFEDQALWRFIMKGIFHNMSCYGELKSLKSFEDMGISKDKIPRISNIDRKLQKFGWRACCISGFIPPQAFMEFQMYKILPIASEIRTIQHTFYTPAPDIVHEAVGHVPFLTNPIFSKFLKTYAQTVLKSITSQDDINKYLAIRRLSDLKEDSRSTKKQIQQQENKLKTIIKNISYVSEASYLSRLIWWTSEYGLMGSMQNPKIYGAGLVSSIGEALHINKVKKIRLSASCLKYSFDITKFQPQLFVAKDFKHLLNVLNVVSKTLAYNRGGFYGIDQAIKSKTVNTIVLDSGLQISGIVQSSLQTKSHSVFFIKCTGPVQLSVNNKQLKGHGQKYHNTGYSTALAYLSKIKKDMHLWTNRDLQNQGFKKGKHVQMRFKGGIVLKGRFHSCLRGKSKLLLLTFKNCLIVDKHNKILYQPAWGDFDLAVGRIVSSVFSGAADPNLYKVQSLNQACTIPVKQVTAAQKKTYAIYKQLSLKSSMSKLQLQALIKKIQLQDSKTAWLMVLELLNIFKKDSEIQKYIKKSTAFILKTKIQNKLVCSLGKIFFKM